MGFKVEEKRTGAISPKVPSGIKQREAVSAFIRAGGASKKSKRGHTVLRMPNGRLISLPSGVLKKGLLENQIKLAGLTIDEFVGYL